MDGVLYHCRKRLTVVGSAKHIGAGFRLERNATTASLSEVGGAVAVTLVSDDVAKSVSERLVQCTVGMIVVSGNAFMRKMSRRFCLV